MHCDLLQLHAALMRADDLYDLTFEAVKSQDSQLAGGMIAIPDTNSGIHENAIPRRVPVLAVNALAEL